MWTCPNCGEQIEKDFAVCWNCEAERPEGIDLNEKWKIVLVCPRCHAESQYLCTRNFFERKNTPAALIVELVTDSKPIADWVDLDAYLCPKCGLEFFIDSDVSSDLRAP
jgi:predicted RNA-binding Zn-ribbon protein involved in translation (DUF1610 family)